MRHVQLGVAGICVLGTAILLYAAKPAAPPAAKESVIYSFQGGSDGSDPVSDLVLDARGNLYGTTSSGGASGFGTVFELTHTANGWKEIILHSFSGPPNDGARPITGLIFDAAGNLYGTTSNGGSGGGGTVFKLTNSGGHWSESILYSFTGSNGDGAYPNNDLVFDSQGNLYGTTQAGGVAGACAFDVGCGTIFQLSPQSKGTWTETVLWDFNGAPDGALPSSNVLIDANGNLWGQTQYGGSGQCNTDGHYKGCGVIYELSLQGGKWTETIPFNFVRGGEVAVVPAAGLLFDANGDLLGTSQQGGDGWGTLFEVKENKKKVWEGSVLHRFTGAPDGRGPLGRLITDRNGDLFGVAGAFRFLSYDIRGTVFEFTPSKNGWKERVLYSFTGGTDGDTPEAGPAIDPQGHLYGTTSSGGGTGCNGGGCGTVYQIIP